METGRFIGELTRLGLTTYEARAYIALLGRDSFTAAQVAKRAGLPRQRIYDVLGTLIEKGLASGRPGRVVKYAPVAPELAIERLMNIQREEVRRLELSAVDMIQGMMPAYRTGLEHTDPLEYIEVLREAAAINARFAELQAGVKREILVFTKPPYATPPQENVEGLEVTRTHTARSVYEFGVFDDPAVTEGVRRFIEAGEEARFVERLPMKMVIIDEEIVLFGLEDPVGGRQALTVMVVEHAALATVLKVAFNTVWDGGLTFDEAHDRFVKQRLQSA
jgi:sugar-specific transcriptional regulator TrmB